MLIIIPLLVHQLTKTFIFSPLVEKYFDQNQEIVFIIFQNIQTFLHLIDGIADGRNLLISGVSFVH